MIEIFVKYLRDPIAFLAVLRGRAAYRYIFYNILGGLVFGILGFAEVIARKSLDSSAFLVTLLAMTMPVGSLLSIWWARLLVGRSQRKFLLTFAVAGYLVLATGIFLHSMTHMLWMFSLFALGHALVVPSENRVLQQHVPAKKTGKIFGLSTGVRMALAALSAYFVGQYMDVVDGGYRHAFLLAAVVGLGAVWLLSSISTGHIEGAEPQPIDKTLFLGPLQKVSQLMKERPDFKRFETAFMFYGIAFMMTLPVVPLFLVDDLKFSYGQIGLVRGTIPQLVMIAGIPLFGRLFDRTTPHRMSVYVFALLAVYPALLVLSGFFEGMNRTMLVYLAFGVFGVAMSGIMVLWSLSSLRFAGDHDVGVYHSVHVAATGIRGAFAPLLGYLVMNYFGKTVALLVSTCVWIFASGLMIYMRKRDIATGHFRSLRAA